MSVCLRSETIADHIVFTISAAIRSQSKWIFRKMNFTPFAFPSSKCPFFAAFWLFFFLFTSCQGMSQNGSSFICTSSYEMAFKISNNHPQHRATQPTTNLRLLPHSILSITIDRPFYSAQVIVNFLSHLTLCKSHTF